MALLGGGGGTCRQTEDTLNLNYIPLKITKQKVPFVGSLLYMYASLNLRQSLSFTVCLSSIIHARLLLSGQLFLAMLRLTPESHLPSHPDGSQDMGSFQANRQSLPPGLVNFFQC